MGLPQRKPVGQKNSVGSAVRPEVLPVLPVAITGREVGGGTYCLCGYLWDLQRTAEKIRGTAYEWMIRILQPPADSTVTGRAVFFSLPPYHQSARVYFDVKF